MKQPSHTPQTLDKWIEIATTGLPPSACHRIAEEIRDHYTNLLDEQYRQGYPQPQAESFALAQLGAPEAVGRSYRDAHFSRQTYAKARLSTLLLFGIMTINLLLFVLSSQFDNSGQPNIINQYSGYWDAITGIGTLIFVYWIAQACLMFWRECFDIQPHNTYKTVFMVSLLGGIGASVLYQMMNWAEWYNLLNIRLHHITATPLWRGIFSILPTIWFSAAFIVGMMLLAFVPQTWQANHRLARGMVFTNGVFGSLLVIHSLLNLIPHTIAPYYIHRYYLPLFSTSFVISITLLCALLFITFHTLSIQGRAFKETTS